MLVSTRFHVICIINLIIIVIDIDIVIVIDPIIIFMNYVEADNHSNSEKCS